MTQLYKIKVGIEEFPVEEVDIPRIVEAMKSNDMVKIGKGVFRGNSILAVCRDEKREAEARTLAIFNTPESLEEIKKKDEEERIREKLKEQRLACNLCDHTGWKEEFRENNVVRVPCVCTILK